MDFKKKYIQRNNKLKIIFDYLPFGSKITV